MITETTPLLIAGDIAIDDRGEVGFVNGFSFADIKRFYTVKNHHRGFVRAWHAHRHEAKYVSVTEGAAVIGAVKIDSWEAPTADVAVARYVLSAEKPAVLFPGRLCKRIHVADR